MASTTSTGDDSEPQFCLKWNNFQTNITSEFESLRNNEDFIDVTIACGGRKLGAHKVVLSACSPFFKDLFKNNPCQHPIIFMQDVRFEHVVHLMEFMYAGEVNVAQADLNGFLRTAEALQIRGLTDSNSSNDSKSKPMPFDESNNNRSERVDARASADLCHTKIKSDTAKVRDVDAKVDVDNDALVVPKEESDDFITDDELVEDGMECEPHAGYGESGDAANGEGTASLRNFSNDSLTNQNNECSSDKSPMDRPGKKQKRRTRIWIEHGKFPSAEDAKNVVRAEKIWKVCSSHLKSTDYKPSNTSRFQRALNKRRYLNHPLDMSTSSIDKQSYELFNRILSSVERVDESISSGNGGVIKLADGIEVCEEQLRSVKWNDYRKLTRGLATILFSPIELATSSVTGQRWSRAGTLERPVKPALDRAKVQAIISYVASRFPAVEVSNIKKVLAYKCKENSTAYKIKAMKLLE